MNLDSPIGELAGVGPAYERRLEKLGIASARNLLNHLPHRYLDYSLTSPVARVSPGETVTIRGWVTEIKNIYTRSGKKMQVAQVEDSSGVLPVIWFNQPFLVRTIFVGDELALAGKVDWFGRKKALFSPEYEKVAPGRKNIHTGGLIPVYPETAGVSSKWLRTKIAGLFSLAKNSLHEFLPEKILTELNLVDEIQAYQEVHFPRSLEAAQAGRNRLAFDELLLLQIASLRKKIDWQANSAFAKLTVTPSAITKFLTLLPFVLTASQKRSVDEIVGDLGRNVPMNRLLLGDVGSGKTVVAAAGMLVAFLNGFQSVLMAPTQILAQQHFETLKNLLSPFGVGITLITSDTRLHAPGVQATGGQVFVGTHALIHKKVSFEKTALVVIDEQHRFGVEQREHLVASAGKKGSTPHVLTMSATPIPRTVALTLYGDLDLSTLDEMPSGRQKITTWVVPPQKKLAALGWIRNKIVKEKVQAFYICPLIEESDKETLQSVKAATREFRELKTAFPSLAIGILHGRQSEKTKNQTLAEFKKGKIDILVSTPVVEVGIDVANAAIMLVEGSERFGLAQLHQLRGRVGRGAKKSYCLLFSQSRSPKVYTRLKAMEKSLSGSELAELDLRLRGPGEVFGTRQHGFPELKIAAWSDFELIKKSKSLAEAIMKEPARFPELFRQLRARRFLS